MKKVLSAMLILTMIISMVCVGVSAEGVLISENCTSMAAFMENFVAGAFAVNESEGYIYGYKDARVLQSKYDDSTESGVFDNTQQTWLTYDFTMTLAVGLDEDGQRDISLMYANDNLVNAGYADSREFITFGYDITNERFMLTYGGTGIQQEDEAQLMAPVSKELDMENATQDYTFGMSIMRQRIRCYVDGELIFDYYDENDTHRIAQEINSPVMLWNTGNLVKISNITVATEGYLFPKDVPTPTPTETNDPVPTPTESNNPNPDDDVTKPAATTRIETAIETDEEGNQHVVTKIITEAPTADTNKNGTSGGTSSKTGDVTFIVVAVMVVTLGTALIFKKVSVK